MESATVFFDRGRWKNTIDANPEETERMSETTPMISLDWSLPLIARMSVKFSEKTLTEGKFRVSAMQRADRIAIASAIRGVLMKLCPIEPWIGLSKPRPVKTQPKPAFFSFLSHAASVIQMRDSSADRINLCGSSSALSMLGKSLLLFVGTCAWVHSLANQIPLLAVSSGESFRFSNIRRFRNIQIVHSTQGRMLCVIPVGGRQIIFLNWTTASLTLVVAAM